MRFFTKIKPGFYYPKTDISLLNQNQKRIIHLNDPQRRFILWIVSKGGCSGYMIGSDSSSFTNLKRVNTVSGNY